MLMAVEQIIAAPAAADTGSMLQLTAANVISTGSTLDRTDIARRFMQRVELTDLLPINKRLTSAQEQTMISLLGSPHMPLTTVGQNERASDLVKRNVVTERMTQLFRLTGLQPAIDDVKAILAKAFAKEPDLESVLSTEGMLSVRMRKPTDGSISTHVSNHAWGTAVDLRSWALKPRPIRGAPCRGSSHY
jgi:hypothetical protein